MTTADFIRRWYKTRHCSSVFKDEQGNITSYGPLERENVI